MKYRLLIVGLLVGALIFTSACGMVNTLLGGRSAGTVTDLWSDVPRMDGLTKANLDIPLAARLMIQTFSQGKMNFVAYTSAGLPQAVIDFYTTERMAGAGWTSSETTGCYGDTSTEAAGLGAMCIFGKEDGGKKEILAIVAATDDTTKGTAIFFVRIDASGTPSQ